MQHKTNCLLLLLLKYTMELYKKVTEFPITMNTKYKIHCTYIFDK